MTPPVEAERKFIIQPDWQDTTLAKSSSQLANGNGGCVKFIYFLRSWRTLWLALSNHIHMWGRLMISILFSWQLIPPCAGDLCRPTYGINIELPDKLNCFVFLRKAHGIRQLICDWERDAPGVVMPSATL